VLPICRHGRVARFDRRAVTMMIYQSKGYVIRRRVGTYRRVSPQPRRSARAADVLRTIRRATDLSRRRVHRASDAARSFSTPLRYRPPSRLPLRSRMAHDAAALTTACERLAARVPMPMYANPSASAKFYRRLI